MVSSMAALEGRSCSDFSPPVFSHTSSFSCGSGRNFWQRNLAAKRSLLSVAPPLRGSRDTHDIVYMTNQYTATLLARPRGKRSPIPIVGRLRLDFLLSSQNIATKGARLFSAYLWESWELHVFSIFRCHRGFVCLEGVVGAATEISFRAKKQWAKQYGLCFCKWMGLCPQDQLLILGRKQSHDHKKQLRRTPQA